MAAAVLAAHPDMPALDVMADIGGSPEGVVTACAMKALGGRILARLWPTSSEERQRTIDAGHDLDRILDTNDLVTSDNTIFVATGITPGDLVDGVTYLPNGGAHPVDRDAVGLWTIRYRERHEVAGIDWK